MRIALILLAACSVQSTQFTPDEAKPAALSLTPNGDVALGVVVLGQTSGKTTLFVTNDSDAESGPIDIGFDDATLGFTIMDDECTGQPLAGHRTCSFQLRFTPALAAAVQTNIHVSAAPGGELSKVILATGLIPGQIDITESSYNFLGMAIGAPQKTAVFTVRALGQTMLGKPVPTIDGDTASYAIQSTTCNAPLAPSESCKVTVSYTPSAVGARTASLSVTAGPNEIDAATLEGLGFARVAVTKTGNGAITSVDAGLDCGAICANDVATSPVTLTAVPGPNAVFAGWTGGCSGTGTCTLLLTGAKSVGANFTCSTGYGACGIGGACTPTTDDANNCGTCDHVCPGVTNGFGVCANSQCGLGCSPGYAACGATCMDLTSDANNCGTCGHVCPGTACSASQCLPPGQIDIIDAPVDFGASNIGATVFRALTIKNTGTTAIGMAAASLGTSDGSYSISTNNCPATLAPNATCAVTIAFRPLTVGAKAGSLNVTAMPGGSDAVTLSGTGRAHVTVQQSGVGTVTSQPAGINCGVSGGSCSGDFTAPVTLQASPGTGFAFTGWSGCTGATCTLDTSATIGATFTAQSYPLTVDINSQFGAMTSSTVSTQCAAASCGPVLTCNGATCTANAYYGASIMLTANPDSYSRFIGWTTGPCAGSTMPTCSFSMPAGALTVKAAFDWFATFSIRANHGALPAYDPLTARATGTGIVCTNTTTLSGACTMHPARNSQLSLTYQDAGGPYSWNTCIDTFLYAQASGDCRPPGGTIFASTTYACNLTFSTAGDYTSQYDVYCSF
jgi:hypothetical protein